MGEIKELEGHKEVCTDTADGRVVWKVAPQVLDDELKDAREYKEKLFSDEKYNAHKNNTDDWDYNKSFCALWPSTIDNGILSLQEVIRNENVKRRENFQRPIKVITNKSTSHIWHSLYHPLFAMERVRVSGMIIKRIQRGKRA